MAEHLNLLFQSLTDEIFDTTEKVGHALHPQRVVDVDAFSLILQDFGSVDPILLVAVTINVYGVPFFNPFTMWVVEVSPETVLLPPLGLEVTV